MNIFSDQSFLYISLGVLLCICILYFWSEKTKKSKILQLTSLKLLPRIAPHYSTKRNLIKFGIFTLGLILLSIALARPQWGTERRTNQPTGIDLIIAIDVSKSMWARDVKPNRLERVKLSISNLIEGLKGDRVGLIAFAGSAFLQCPLTLDHQAFINALKNIEVGTIKTGGTDYVATIDEAAQSFSKDDRDKFLILVSDGQYLEGEEENGESYAGETLRRAKGANKDDIKIFSIGIGSKEGVRIPTDPIDVPARNFLRDYEGKTVITQLDDTSLKAISAETNGKYYPLGSTGQGLVSVFKTLKSIGEQKKREQISSEIPVERFQPFVLLGLFALLFNQLTPSTVRGVSNLSSLILMISFLFFGGCLKQDNIMRAEEAAKDNNWDEAAKNYEIELNASAEMSSATKAKILLNTGLAYAQAGRFDLAKERLQQAIDQSLDSPKLQSQALNELGNLFYLKTNQWLDQQNVMQARSSWEQSRKYYESAIELDGNLNAEGNLASLNKQIEERINSMVCLINGLIWRDKNGDGIAQKNESRLQGKVFWDKNNDGEHNSSNEPFLNTNASGQFAFEWISSVYPVTLSLDSELVGDDSQKIELLVPVFPAPPPPLNADSVKNHSKTIQKAGASSVLLPYRAAPIIRGKVWMDKNGDAQKNEGEGPYSQAKLFLDQNGNFNLDENETSFAPDSNGSFLLPLPPGQYSLCIAPENADANITFPIEEKKAYLTWVDYESPSDSLLFGVQDNQQQDSQSSENNQTQQPQTGEQENDQNTQESESSENAPPTEVNALYERLLQEMESKSKNLYDEKQRAIRTTPKRRDY
jgi:Ca-activated chloride channel family protein